MPYRLRVTQEEVRQELAKMGFKGLSDDTVAAMHKDLLKMIKSDLRKMKQDAEHTGISDLPPLRTTSQHASFTDPKANLPPHTSLQSSLPTLKKTHAKEQSYSSLSASYTSKDKDESTGESGYSDVESTTSGMSDVDSFSAAAEVPQKQSNTEVKPRRPKKPSTKEQMKNSKEPVLGTAHLQTIALNKKNIVKQVGKRDLPQYPSKPDPVRLYHYYKAHWDQYKMPGEDPHLKLRWAVRSKLFFAE
ncbi:hydrolethalus syndrome protein 1 homolog isoform X2 [Portunus trituberculatus]|nr:hydrolethalus syndrome protein 1 homolog isoform X2 [Portunus trituberculatus]